MMASDFVKNYTMAGILTIPVMFFVDAIVTTIRFVVAHPILTTVMVICYAIYYQIWIGLGGNIMDIEMMGQMSQAEYAEKYDTVSCNQTDNVIFCDFKDRGYLKVNFDAKTRRPISMDFDANDFNQKYRPTKEFFKYALHYIGVEKYHDPYFANIDRATWMNVSPHVESATLYTSDNLSVTSWSIKFK